MSTLYSAWADLMEDTVRQAFLAGHAAALRGGPQEAPDYAYEDWRTHGPGTTLPGRTSGDGTGVTYHAYVQKSPDSRWWEVYIPALGSQAVTQTLILDHAEDEARDYVANNG